MAVSMGIPRFFALVETTYRNEPSIFGDSFFKQTIIHQIIPWGTVSEDKNTIDISFLLANPLC